MSRQQDRVTALRSIRLFARLDERAVRGIARAVEEREFAKGDVLVREGSLGLAVYFLLEGRCEVRRTIDDEEKVVTTLAPGDFFGEMAVLDPGPRTATVAAIDEVRVYALAAWDFKAQMQADASIPMQILPALARRFRRANEELLAVGRGGSELLS